MSDKITYLIGAGASANTIPVVNQMNNRVFEILTWLKNIKDSSENTNQEPERNINLPESFKTQNSTLGTVIEELSWLLDESKDYHSVDTLARKYYLVDDYSKYERLKSALILYFSIEQSISIGVNESSVGESFMKNKVDKRYDSFISILASKDPSKKISINENVSILSWNYDIQFELSLKRFTNKKIKNIKENYQIFPKLYDNSTEIANGFRRNEFSLVKLNGNAIFSASRDSDFPTIFDEDITNSTEEQQLDVFLKYWKSFDRTDNSALRFFNFAWEKNEDFNGRRHQSYHSQFEVARKIANETDILVVIGYSFPTYNRPIDTELFDSLKKIKKVYIQDRNPEKIESTIRNAFKIMQERTGVGVNEYKIPIHRESNTDQFVIPYELNTK